MSRTGFGPVTHALKVSSGAQSLLIRRYFHVFSRICQLSGDIRRNQGESEEGIAHFIAQLTNSLF